MPIGCVRLEPATVRTTEQERDQTGERGHFTDALRRRIDFFLVLYIGSQLSELNISEWVEDACNIPHVYFCDLHLL